MAPQHNGDNGPEPQGHLLNNLVLFGRLLRRLGIDVTPSRMIELVGALSIVDVADRDDFFFTLRTFLVHRHDHLALFEHAFDLFWRKHQGMPLEVTLFRSPDEDRALQPDEVQFLDQPDSEPDGPQQSEDELQELVEVVQTYSSKEQLREKDFGQMSEEELESIHRFVMEMAWHLGRKQTRRLQPGPSARIDLRRLIRRNLRYGGELIELPTQRQKTRPRPLVLIADVSGSMKNYTRLLLYFLYSLTEGLSHQVEAFVFSTRLSRITRELHEHEIEQALEQVARSVPDWSGGTRIGDALKQFNFRWARRVLGSGAIVVLISDGWDRGDPELLGEEMARLQRSCHRLIWLNPLLGSPRYEPLTRGMQAALPYVDDFLPVHNLTSLEELASHLGQIDDIRLERRGIRSRTAR